MSTFVFKDNKLPAQVFYFMQEIFGTAFLSFAANSLVSGSNFDLSQSVLLVTLCTWSTGAAHFNTGLTIA